MTRDTRDLIALVMALIVGLFVIGSLVTMVALAYAGEGPSKGVWGGLFSLVTALIGALGGYLAGTTVEARKRDGTPPTGGL